MNTYLTPIFAAFLVCSSARAAITIYTDEVAFQNATTALVKATDGFDDLSVTEYSSPLSRTVGGYSYRASAGPASNLLYGGNDVGDESLTLDNRNDIITLTGFSPGITGIGGHFFASNASGRITSGGDLMVTAKDADGTVTQVLLGATRTSFLGFVSDKPIESVTVGMNVSTVEQWPSVENLILAGLPVPEPSHGILASLGFVGMLARRSRKG